jgi:tetratricopeptide (TPR) repeat protein
MEAHDTCRKLLDENDSKTLVSLGLLALVLGSQGKYEAAEEINRRALELKEKVLGKEHLDTLKSMNNLMKSQGKYEAAEEINRRALELREKVLRKEHPDTLISMNNLALMLNSQGKYEVAEEMNQQALELKPYGHLKVGNYNFSTSTGCDSQLPPYIAFSAQH